MAGRSSKKRPTEGRLQRPAKKQKRKQEYHSESESQLDQDFDAVDLLDSDDIHNATLDDVAEADDDSSSGSEDEAPKTKKSAKMTVRGKGAEAPSDKNSERGSDEDDDDDEENDDEDDNEDDADPQSTGGKRKLKRNDPTAFATSLSKILSTKLSSSKRADPVLARSAAAHEASKAAVDTALESKLRRQLKEQKRVAQEKGRVRDILLAPTNKTTGEPDISTAEVLETERKLRRVAKKGVIQMFNAVRAAQIKAAEAESDVKNDGVIGVNRRKEKVNELSKKGFLELIASGGGGLKKGALEEA